MKYVHVIGAGLAGCEATWQLVKRNIPVKLHEMRPQVSSPAHKSALFSELVCSNSLRSDSLQNAVGILKAEMRLLDSLIIQVADSTRIPAGSALAVDREGFAQKITDIISKHPLVEVIHQEMQEICEGPTIIASGPLTSDALSDAIKKHTKQEYFHFYDAAAPIVEKESINLKKAYYKSRYDHGDQAAYINCPMNQREFENFYQELINAQCVKQHAFEEHFFEGCMPIEEIARRGAKTLLFGPLKPVGLAKENASIPHAVVQLRQDNVAASLYNLVGFQTHLTWGEQKRILQLIPGLENVNIVRYGVMHRNSYLCAPKILKATYQDQQREDLFFAGQLSGVEGYVESAASGLLAGINMAQLLHEKACVVLPPTCVIGSMAHYITHADPNSFQPMNANFGIMQLLAKVKKSDRKAAYAKQALEIISNFESTLT